MKLENARVILTGATGGIGTEITQLLNAEGAHVALLGRNADELNELSNRSEFNSNNLHPIQTNLLDHADRQEAVQKAIHKLGGLDLLINNAGMMSFRPFAEEDPNTLENIIQLNTIAPMLITRQILPTLLEQNSGRIVNIGSTFGSIAFAWFTAYSTSKFALRGFSEALRRELQESNVGVTYIAPRSVKTKLNTSAVYRMADAVKMNMDNPKWVAEQITRAIKSNKKDCYLGFPESLFVRINALFPRLVDAALRKQNQQMLSYAKGEHS